MWEKWDYRSIFQWKIDVGSIFGAVKASAPSIREKVLKLPIIVTRGPNTVEFSHVETSQRHGKRYRNEKSLFTLSDSDSEAETVAVTSSLGSSEPKVSFFIFKCLVMIVEASNYMNHRK